MAAKASGTDHEQPGVTRRALLAAAGAVGLAATVTPNAVADDKARVDRTFEGGSEDGKLQAALDKALEQPEVPSPAYVETAELGPHHDKQEVTMTFTIEDEYMISGTVPVGQVPSFGIRPKLNRDGPKLSVLVSGDLANIMYRFGLGADVNRAKGVVIRATGKITVFPAPNGAPDKQPTYQLNISDWKKFRIIPDPNPNKP